MRVMLARVDMAGHRAVAQDGDAVCDALDLVHAVADVDDAHALGLKRVDHAEQLRDLGEVLNVWARFIYGPLLDNRVRTIADNVALGEYGRKEAFEVRRLLKEKGPVTIPAEFVFMDRAAIGLGAAYLRLGAELNFYQLFEDSIEGFSTDAMAARQAEALSTVGLSYRT